jgi:hypothetical protein
MKKRWLLRSIIIIDYIGQESIAMLGPVQTSDLSHIECMKNKEILSYGHLIGSHIQHLNCSPEPYHIVNHMLS